MGKIFDTIKSTLKYLRANQNVYIYSDKYEMIIASGCVAELESKITSKLMNARLKGYSEAENKTVTLFVD